MDLYTSLVRLKQEMNGGVLPPMTPVTGDALKIIDPDFTIGMGALREDAKLGFQCPIRGCGKWTHALSSHVTHKHKSLGGVSALRQALSLPRTAKLTTQLLRDRHTEIMTRRRAAGEASVTQTFANGTRYRGPRQPHGKGTVGALNLRNACLAQLTHKLIDFSNRLGRAPTRREALVEFGSGLNHDVQSVFGSWNAALAHCGISDRGRYEKRDVYSALETLKSWHTQHGELPSAREVLYAKLPLLMSKKTYLRLLKTESWTEAMQRAASMLGIYGGRYGIPEHLKPKDGAAA